MRDPKSAGNMLWAVLLFFAVTLSFYGCGDISNVSSTPPAPAPGPLTILTADPLPAGTVSLDYNVTLAPSGGTPPYTWSLAPGSPTLPNGLALTPSNGKILGVPTTATATRLTDFTLQDSKGQSVHKVLTITVNAFPTPLTIVTNLLDDGLINQRYAFALSPNGGTSPYTWALKAGSPLLPSGLILSTNGVISGTPTVTSSAAHTFTLTDATSLTVEKPLQLTIKAIPLSITTNSLPQGTKNQTYSSTTLAASGGTPPLTWSPIVTPALPSGLTFNAATATISGIPTVEISQTHRFTITDSTLPTNQTVFKDLLLTIGAAPPPLTISTNSLLSGTVTVSYPSTTLAASGGTPPYTWSAVGNLVPAPGLTLDSGGVISGTPSTTSGSPFTRTYRVEDSAVPPQVKTKNLTITVGLPAPPNITTTSASLLPNGTFNQFYTRTLTVQNGTPPFVWSFTGGSPFPNWLILNTQTGVISGTPNVTGTFNFNVQVTDNTGQTDSAPPSLSITIVAQAPPTITPFTLTNGTVNVAYPNTQLAATGGIPPYTWSVTPALPGGLFFNLLGPGIISGTPLNNGTPTTTHIFRVTDSTVPTGQFSELTRNLTINAALTIDTGLPTGPPLPAGTVNDFSYNATLAASGGTGPGTYTWSITGTGAPSTAAPGLTLSSGGVITGTPSTTVGSPFTRTYRVQDSNGVVVTKPLALTVNAALTIDTDNTTLPLPPGIQTQQYSATLAASGGTQPYTWSVDPLTPLPTSLLLDRLTGAITGAPDIGTAVPPFSHTFTVQDSASHSTIKSLDITIIP